MMKRFRWLLLGLVVGGVVFFLPDHAQGIPIVSGMLESIRNGFVSAFNTLREQLVDWGQTLAGDLLTHVPDVWAQAGGGLWGQVGPLLAAADHWLPITEMFGLLGIYFTFIALMVGVKWLLKVIPFVG